MPSDNGTKVDPTPTTTGISFTSAMVRDYRDDMSEFDSFRTVISLPSGTAEVELWAEQALEVMVRGQWYSIDATHSVVVAPNDHGKVVVTIAAEDVAAPALLLRTNGMAKTERYYVFPDADAHAKLSALEGDALYDRREALGISSEYSKTDCQNVAQTLKSLAQTVKYTYDPETGGLGRYVRLTPEPVERADWEVETVEDKPTYRRLTRAEADAASKHAIRVGAELGQGKKKKKKKKKGFGKSIKKAGKSTSKGASSAGKSVGKATSSTVDSAGKVVNDVVDSAGKVTKQLTHGGLIDLADITDDMAKIEGLASDAADQMAKVIREGTNPSMVISVVIGGETLNFLIDAGKHLGAAIASIVKEIGTTVEKLIEWLADLLGWDDIIHTQRVIRDACNKGLDYLADSTQVAKQELRGMIDEFDKLLNANLDNAIEQYGGGIPSSSKRKQVIPSKVTDKIDWLMDHFFTSKDDGESTEGLSDDEGKSFKDLIDEFVETVTSDPELEAALGGALDQFVGIFAQPHKAPELLVGIALNLLKAMLNLALALVEGLISLTLDLLKKTIELFRKLLNAKLHIPFLENLFKMISGGEPLTLLNFVTLVVAVPTNLLGKSMGAVPFKGRGALGQSATEAERAEAKAIYDWGIVYGVCQLLGTYLLPSAYADDGGGGDVSRKDIFGLGLAVVAQIAGFPNGYPCYENWHASKGPAKLANYIWLYQWLMVAYSAVMLRLDTGDDGETIGTVVIEVVHLGLFITLDCLVAQDDRIDTCCILDPIPGIFTVVKVSALEPYNLGTVVIGPAVASKVAYSWCYLDATVDHYKNAKRDW